MSPSLSYYLVLIVLKLKRVKSIFSTSPVDYQKLRKEDVKKPSSRFWRGYIMKRFKAGNSVVTSVKSQPTSEKLILFIHGGAYISGPGMHHWKAVRKMARLTHHEIWLVDYPKSPENDIREIFMSIKSVYHMALTTFKPDEVVLIGDSVGGSLALTLLQTLNEDSDEMPKSAFLISPVLDATLSNDAIPEVDLLDPMLSRKGIRSAKEMCAKDVKLTDPTISPINGSLDGLPPLHLYFAEYDITYPDQLLFLDKLKTAKVEYSLRTGRKMPHIWPLIYQLKEGRESLNGIIEELKLI
ncbi:MAG: alpha/beta hydrolase [Bacteroidota bacterium]